jgi:ankyrin repeat protein
MADVLNAIVKWKNTKMRIEPESQPPPLPPFVEEKAKLDELTEAIKEDDLKTIRRLLDGGLNINGHNSEGETVLRTTVRFSALEFVLKFVQLLLKKGADVNGRNAQGETALFCAGSRGLVEIPRALIDAGADVNARDLEGRVAINSLLLHPMLGNLATIELFLSAGARVDVADDAGRTPLHRAVGYENVRAARLLLKYGAEVNAKTKNQETPLYLHLSEERGNEGREMQDLLTAAGGLASGSETAKF